MNDGLGVFEASESIGVQGRGVTSDDLNGDGLDDLIALVPKQSPPSEAKVLLRSSTLPIELIAFDAVAQNNNVVLTWSTATEMNNAGFEIEQAAEGAPFRMAGFVEGRGTTTDVQRYRHVVQNVEPGTYRFRLKQVDFDGTSSYSPAVEVIMDLDRAHTLSSAYPNPVSTTAQVDLTMRSPQYVTVDVYDALGRHVKTLFDGELSAYDTVPSSPRAATCPVSSIFTAWRASPLWKCAQSRS